MSDAPPPFNPYQTPQPLPVGGMGFSAQRPGFLTAICIVGMILGGLGLLGSCTGTVGLVAGQAIQKSMNLTPPNMPAEQKQAQEDFQKEVNAVTDQFFPFNVTLLIGNFLLSAFLLAGGIQAFRGQEWGRKCLATTCLLASIYQLLQSVMQVFMQIQMSGAMGRMMEGMMKSAPQGKGGPPPELAGTVMQASMWVGIGFSGCIAAMFLAYYLTSFFYLRRPAIVALFSTKSTAGPTMS